MSFIPGQGSRCVEIPHQEVSYSDDKGRSDARGTDSQVRSLKPVADLKDDRRQSRRRVVFCTVTVQCATKYSISSGLHGLHGLSANNIDRD